MLINFLDTSAILNGGLTSFNNIYVSPLSLIELENIKNSKTKNESVKYQARRAVNFLIENNDINFTEFSNKQRQKVLNHFPLLLDITDHHILAEAYLLAQKNELYFVTSDGAQYLFGNKLPFRGCIFYQDIEQNSLFTGWRDFYPTEEQLNILYSEVNNNILECKTNEFAKILMDGELKDILFWNGTEYRRIRYKEFTSTLGEKVRPRNTEQKMYLDLLQNKDIPVKLCVAKFGTGKSWLALSYALREVQNGRFDKIVFVKNNLEVVGAGQLGEEVAHLYSNIFD